MEKRKPTQKVQNMNNLFQDSKSTRICCQCHAILAGVHGRIRPLTSDFKLPASFLQDFVLSLIESSGLFYMAKRTTISGQRAHQIRGDLDPAGNNFS